MDHVFYHHLHIQPSTLIHSHLAYHSSRLKYSLELPSRIFQHVFTAIFLLGVEAFAVAFLTRSMNIAAGLLFAGKNKQRVQRCSLGEQTARLAATPRQP